ncbi:MAG: hypothetical protein U5N86_12490 [Planctomycetota bacterium]|nr:hypothetical protein [Planctomycetota bacterium]
MKLGKNNNEYVIVKKASRSATRYSSSRRPPPKTSRLPARFTPLCRPPLPTPGDEPQQPKESGSKKIDKESLKNMSKEDLQKLRDKFKNSNKGGKVQNDKPLPKSD